MVFLPPLIMVKSQVVWMPPRLAEKSILYCMSKAIEVIDSKRVY